MGRQGPETKGSLQAHGRLLFPQHTRRQRLTWGAKARCFSVSGQKVSGSRPADVLGAEQRAERVRRSPRERVLLQSWGHVQLCGAGAVAPPPSQAGRGAGSERGAPPAKGKRGGGAGGAQTCTPRTLKGTVPTPDDPPRAPRPTT